MYHKVHGRTQKNGGEKQTVMVKKLKEWEQKFTFCPPFPESFSGFKAFVRKYPDASLLGYCNCGKRASGRAIIPDAWRRNGSGFVSAGFYPYYQEGINNDTIVLVGDYFISQLVCVDCIDEAVNVRKVACVVDDEPILNIIFGDSAI